MTSKRVLFLPSDGGGGFGHVSRCQILAEQLLRQCTEVLLLVNQKNTLGRLSQSLPGERVAIPSHPLRYLQRLKAFLARGEGYNYTLFDGIEFQLLRDGIWSEDIFVGLIRRCEKVINRFKPDLIVGDTSLVAATLGKMAGIPVIQIVRYLNHPDYGRVIWWKDYQERIQAPRVLPLINAALGKLRLPQVSRSIDLLEGQQYLIPSIAKIEPVSDTDHKNIFVGPLTLPLAGQTDLAEIYWRFPKDNPLLYVTFGGGAQSLHTAELVDTVVRAFAGKAVNVVIANPQMVSSQGLALPENIRMFKWVPGQAMIAACDLVVSHGGYGTFMETLRLGKPMLVVPFHAEQEGNGRRLADLGCGTCLLPYREEDLIPVVKSFAGKPFAYLVSHQMRLTGEALAAAALRMLDNSALQKSIARIQVEINRFDPEKAMKFLNGYL